jgi:2,3,4,5-tetrahydropyridine-2,6-dicarboxylate N-succinyltransferase
MQAEIDKLFAENRRTYPELAYELFGQLKQGLNDGSIRAAEPDPASKSGWKVNAWVKKGILLGFRMGGVVDWSIDNERQPWLDKSTFPVKRIRGDMGIRIVPGGSSIRDGCYVGMGVVCMPPMFINTGAYIGPGTMIDSHALIGSCAQIGANCHISAASQIGGVLEPVGAMPVIIEDDVLVGGNCGVYEGTVVKTRAVLGTGTILNRSTPVYDIVRNQIYSATDDEPLVIPEEAVVVAGSRPITKGPGKDWGIALYTPVIVKYRDSKTDTKIQLEELLRSV